MTSAVQVDPYTVDQQQQTPSAQEAAVIAAVALFLASVVAVKAITLPGHLVDRLVGLGLNRRAVRAAGKLTLEPALTGRTRWGSPTVAPEPATTTSVFAAPGVTPDPGQSVRVLSVLDSRGSASERARAVIAAGRTTRRFGPQTMVKRMAANEPTMRARYLLAAARRLAKAAAEGRFTAALRREQAYLAAHRRAGQRRAAAARAYDEVARGQSFLRWSARMDSRTTPDCAALNGTIWHVSTPPVPPPGARHIHCRCTAVPVATPSAQVAA